ncbi:hypothetical protein GCM10011386_12010 [Parapedobacter defluvii]|uniref:Fasciclin domain-containing protein n=2 Tax=Parapedobacter defluvii TaxID=2045106 RepID=A0ABQ1L9P0_9SPHI|nr:hypothetical protein GCM10011386_12010 [Parapedobacter defluvii]
MSGFMEQLITMNTIKQVVTHTGRPLLALLLVSSLLSSCKQDEYYTDGGKANPYFDGTIMDYLDSRPIELDSVAEVARLAGLDEVLNTEELTFFAPKDEEIRRLIGQVNYEGEDPFLKTGTANQRLYDLGLDTIQTLSDIDSVIWRKYLERYLFHGKKLLKDYPQIDFDILSTFGGENYIAYNNTVSNIGVVFNDAVTDAGKPTETRLKYMGYRQLHISYIPNVSDPARWVTHPVSSSDIQPLNGVVHVLDFNQGGGFGFNRGEVIQDIIQSKR